MKIALIYPDPYIHIPRRPFANTLRELGHQVENLYLQEILFKTSSQDFQAYHPKKDLLDYDGYIVRQTSRRFKQAMALVYFLKKHNKKVLNQHFALGKSCTNKLATAELLARYKIPQIKTYFPNKKKHLAEIFNEIRKPVVAKRILGSKGRGVQKFNQTRDVYHFLKNKPLKEYLLQEFVPYDRDIRVITIEGKAVAALKRVPPKDNFIANISQGAKAYEIKITSALRKTAERVARIIPDKILGIDLVFYKKQYWVLEVNCSPGLGGYTKKTRRKVVKKIISLFQQ